MIQVDTWTYTIGTTAIQTHAPKHTADPQKYVSSEPRQYKEGFMLIS